MVIFRVNLQKFYTIMSMSKKKKYTVGGMLKSLKERLEAEKIENVSGNAEAILEKAANLDRTEIFLNMDMDLALNEVDKAERYLKRRLSGEPLQYIMGETEFYGVPLLVDERVLIPRPETEILVHWDLEVLEAVENPRILDVGTGSGSIAVAIAVNHPECKIFAFDKSLNALKLAAGNSRLNDVRDQIQFVVGDLFREDFINSVGGNFDLVACNPPYIATVEMDDLQVEVREYEPRAALTDEADGLQFYRRLVKVVPRLCREGGWVMVEAAETRGAETLEIMKAVLPEAEIRNDFAGKPRVVGGVYKKL